MLTDWYLTVRDNEWCDTTNRADSTTNSLSTTSKVPSSTSERLQQLASEQQLVQPSTISYATRMTMPANHKPATNNLIAANHQSISPNSLLSVASSITGGLETNNIIVSATPIADINREASAKAWTTIIEITTIFVARRYLVDINFYIFISVEKLLWYLDNFSALIVYKLIQFLLNCALCFSHLCIYLFNLI